MKRFLSFDIGIKTLAYCLIDIDISDNTMFDIKEWEIIDLDDTQYCVKCKKKAKYKNIDNEYFFCKTHANKSNYIVENISRRYTISYLKELCKTKNIGSNGCNNKTDYYNLVKSYQLKKINKKIDRSIFVHYGCIVKNKFDALFDTKIKEIDYIIIENQMVSKMKLIQAIVAQYFIMKVDIEDNNIICISPKKKLEYIKEQTTYKERKNLSVIIVKDKLKKSESIWLDHLEKFKKKDDLTDSLLQTFAYIKSIKV